MELFCYQYNDQSGDYLNKTDKNNNILPVVERDFT